VVVLHWCPVYLRDEHFHDSPMVHAQNAITDLERRHRTIAVRRSNGSVW